MLNSELTVDAKFSIFVIYIFGFTHMLDYVIVRILLLLLYLTTVSTGIVGFPVSFVDGVSCGF